ncbi:MAG: ATP-binding cassette domain-containing protein, partial [Clostridia bacterium]|nr:ATP-binding cassette domain-containing protein [Clostridia bacterium]
MKPLLEVRDVSLSYHSISGETNALSHISFDLLPGEFLAVVGPSGCGKSTLLNLICGLLAAEEGSILMEGKPIPKGTSRIGYMLQKDHLLEWRSVYKNVLLGLEIRKEVTKEKLAYIDQMLEIYGLDKFRDSRPSQLSGGMRQRAALIRTLALKPDLLLLDEPFSALDYQTRLNVSDDIGKILKNEHKPAILV